MAEPFTPAYEFDFTWNGYELGVSSCEIQEQHATFPTTTQKNRGATSVGIAEYTVNINFEVPVEESEASSYPDSGDRVGPVILVSSGRTRQGTVVVTNRSERLGATGGKTMSYQGVFSGTVIGVKAGATS